MAGATYEGPIRVEPIGEWVPLNYADFVAVQRSTYAVSLSFFQMELPSFDTEAGAKEFEKNPIVRAHCVGRIALPHAQAQRLRELLEEQLKEEKK